MQEYCIRRKELASSLHWEAAAVLLRDGGRGGRVEEKEEKNSYEMTGKQKYSYFFKEERGGNSETLAIRGSE